MFLASSLPYESPKTRLDMRKEAKPFVPSSAVGSREGIAVKAYLSSPDAETLAQEKAFIADRAASNLKMMMSAGYGRVPKAEAAKGEQTAGDLLPDSVTVEPMADLDVVADQPTPPPATEPTPAADA